ncbi:TPA: hypothetical protein ACX6PV_003684 [Photobacterium damselae]
MTSEKQQFINQLESAMSEITHPRYYETERGYQGALIAKLNERLTELHWEGAIIEQEYQKRIKEHSIRIRPDLIIHVPFDSNEHNTRCEGNFVVFELKLGSVLTESSALADYHNLANMCEKLSYPYAVFIVIGGETTFFDKYQGPHKNKILVFKVILDNGQAMISREADTSLTV